MSAANNAASAQKQSTEEEKKVDEKDEFDLLDIELTAAGNQRVIEIVQAFEDGFEQVSQK